MEKIKLSKDNITEVTKVIVNALTEDKNAEVDIEYNGKTYCPNVLEMKTEGILYKYIALVEKTDEDIWLGDVPEYLWIKEDFRKPAPDLKYFSIILRTLVSKIPDKYKKAYKITLLNKLNNFQPYFNGLFHEIQNDSIENKKLITNICFKEDGTLTFFNQLFEKNKPGSKEFNINVEGFPMTEDGIEMALLKGIDIFENKIKELKKKKAEENKDKYIDELVEKYGEENRCAFERLWDIALNLASTPDEDAEIEDAFRPLVNKDISMTIYDNPCSYSIEACDDEGDYVITFENSETCYTDYKIVEDPEDPGDIFNTLVELLVDYSMNAYDEYNDDVILDEIANDIKEENEMGCLDYDRNDGETYEWNLDELNGYKEEIEERAGLEKGTLKYYYKINGYTFEW